MLETAPTSDIDLSDVVISNLLRVIDKQVRDGVYMRAVCELRGRNWNVLEILGSPLSRDDDLL